jgi:WD40 repeat protein
VIAELAIDRGGSVLASASFDGSVRLWKLDTGSPLGVLVGHRGGVRAIAFSPTGAMIASAGDDATVRIWDVESATQLASLEGHTGWINRVRWDGETLESASQDSTIRRWNLTRALRNTIAHPHHDKVEQLAVTTDGTAILSSSEDRTEVGSTTSWGFQDANPGVASLSAAAWLPSHKLATSVDRTLWIDQTKIALTNPIATMASNADYLVTATEQGVVQRWSFDGKLLGEIKLGYVPVHIIFDPTNKWIVLKPTRHQPVGTVVVLDSATMSVVAKPLENAKLDSLSEALIDNHRLVIAANEELHVFETGTWKELRTIGPSHQVETLALLSDGRIVVAYHDGAITVWTGTGQPTATLPPGSGDVDVIAASPDDKLLAVGTSNGAVDVWDLDDSRLIETVHGHRRGVSSIEFAGSHIYSGDRDGRVASWSLDRATRTTAELDRIVKCRVPLALNGETVTAREIDYDDPSCR